jgi:hypothetical protein
MEVFERDCLIYLGTCVAAKGLGKPNRTCFEYAVEGETLNESGAISTGDLKLLPLGLGETAVIRAKPARGLDLGSGPGREIAKEVRGGTVGLILDGRGRPLVLPEDRPTCKRTIDRWTSALDLYPQLALTA